MSGEALVVYTSQTGSSERYARWLAEDLGCPARPLAELGRAGERAGLIILCGWFHAASLKGAKALRRHMAAHPEKRYAVVAVGATPMPCDEWPVSEHEEAFRRSFPAEQYPDLPWCYCQGDFHMERLGALDRAAMRIYFRMLRAEADEGSRRSAAALAGMRAGFDGCDRAYLAPLEARLRKLGWVA